MAGEEDNSKVSYLCWRIVVLAMLLASIGAAGCRPLGSEGDLIGGWRDAEGRPLPDKTDRTTNFDLVVHTTAGSSHCQWDRLIFLTIAWPVGTTRSGGSRDTTASDRRTYVRDPKGVLADYYRSEGFAAVDAPPSGALATEFQREGNTFAIDRDGAAYVRRKDGSTEPWPWLRPVGCA